MGMGDDRDFETDPEWRPIEPFDKPITEQLPEFPADALPKVLQDYGLQVSETFQVSSAMTFCSLLSLLSLCNSGTTYISPKQDWTEPLNLYMLIVAAPSERKSPVLRETGTPIYNYIASEKERRKPEIRKYFTMKKMLEKQKETLINKSASEENMAEIENIDMQLV